MSKQATFRKLEWRDWLLSPLALPVRCQRCLTKYYYPTFLVPIRMAVMAAQRYWDEHKRRRKHRDGRQSEERRGELSQSASPPS
ncbi:MAG TPA: hypothetical protein VHZ24_20925 [Pirellulales bacterium]|jgi:hypothetical protein|nr:hypothetical protein [Pirellulales bacterium]